MTTTTNGATTIRYATIGDGRPLVLLRIDILMPELLRFLSEPRAAA